MQNILNFSHIIIWLICWLDCHCQFSIIHLVNAGLEVDLTISETKNQLNCLLFTSQVGLFPWSSVLKAELSNNSPSATKRPSLRENQTSVRGRSAKTAWSQWIVNKRTHFSVPKVFSTSWFFSGPATVTRSRSGFEGFVCSEHQDRNHSGWSKFYINPDSAPPVSEIKTPREPSQEQGHLSGY